MASIKYSQDPSAWRRNTWQLWIPLCRDAEGGATEKVVQPVLLHLRLSVLQLQLAGLLLTVPGFKPRKYPEKLPVTIARGFCLLAAWLWLSVGLSCWCQLPLAKPDHNEIKRSPAKKNTFPTLAGRGAVGRDGSRASQADCVGTSQSSQAVQEGFRLCPHRKTQVKLEEEKILIRCVLEK